MVFEHLLNLFFLPQVTLYFHPQLRIGSVLFRKSLKSRYFSQILLVCQSHCINDVTDLCNVVSKDYATDKLQVCNSLGLLMSSCRIISKTNCGHYGGSPIKCPVILYVPWLMNEIFWYEPIWLFIDVDHCHKHNSNKMTENPIEYYEFQ